MKTWIAVITTIVFAALVALAASQQRYCWYKFDSEGHLIGKACSVNSPGREWVGGSRKCDTKGDCPGEVG